MRKLSFSFFAILTCAALGAPPRGGPQYQTDRGTVGFLRRHLLSGSDIRYPLELAQAKVVGSGFFVMELAADGTVESLRIERSTGHPSLDEKVRKTLRDYRFKPKTEGPLIWLISFATPATVIVKVYREKKERARTGDPKNRGGAPASG